MTLRASVLTSTVLASLAGCSLLVDSSDLRSGNPQTPTSPDAEAGRQETGDDAAGPQPQLPDDVDSGTVDASGGGGCASLDPPPKLCRDFDDGLPLGTEWSHVDSSPAAGRTITLDDQIASSPPGSARFNFVDGGSCGGVKLERHWTGVAPRRVDLRAQVRPSAPWPGSSGVLAATIHPPASSAYCRPIVFLESSDRVNVTSARVIVSKDGDDMYLPLTRFPLAGVWTEVAMSILEVDGVPKLRVRIGGEDALADAPLTGCLMGGPFEVYAGFHCAASGTGELRLDDIVVDFE